MFHNSALNEMTSKHIMRDRLNEAEQHRLLKQAEVARRQARRKRTSILGVIRQTLARRAVVRPTTATG